MKHPTDIKFDTLLNNTLNMEFFGSTAMADNLYICLCLKCYAMLCWYMPSWNVTCNDLLRHPAMPQAYHETLGLTNYVLAPGHEIPVHLQKWMLNPYKPFGRCLNWGSWKLFLCVCIRGRTNRTRCCSLAGYLSLAQYKDLLRNISDAEATLQSACLIY